MLLTISVVALSQFAVYYWRAVLTGVAAQPVSGRVLEAARLSTGELTGHDFCTLAGLHDLTPDLQAGPNGLGLVRAYYSVMDSISKLAADRMPSLTEWADRERLICARYAAVQIDRRLRANLELAAAIRSC